MAKKERDSSMKKESFTQKYRKKVVWISKNFLEKKLIQQRGTELKLKKRSNFINKSCKGATREESYGLPNRTGAGEDHHKRGGFLLRQQKKELEEKEQQTRKF